jgi:hyperosmotically inducible protein
MKKTSVCLLAVVAVVVLQGSLMAQRPISPRGEERIMREVRHELIMLPWYGVFDNLAYKVNDGTVTLLGEVTRPTLKKDAEAAVKNIEGASLNGRKRLL